MRLTRTEKIVPGCTAERARKILRSWHLLSPAPLAARLGVSKSRAGELLRALAKGGYIQREGDSYRTTPIGNALLGASFAAPIRRKTADRYVEEFLRRIEFINGASEYAYYVVKAVVFGSYLTDASRLGDVDIAVAWVPRYQEREQQNALEEQIIARERKAGRIFSNMVESVFWAQTEVQRYLRKGTRVSLHAIEELEELRPERTKVIFLVEEGASDV